MVSQGRTVLKNGSPVQIGNTERSDPNQRNTKHQTADKIDHKTKSGEDSDLPETQWDDCFKNQIGELNMSGIHF